MTLSVTGTFDYDLIVNINASLVKTWFRFTFLTPDSKHITSLQKQEGDSRGLEEMCGEYETDLMKVCTTILNITAIFSSETCVVYITNICAYFEMAYQINTTNAKDP